MEILFELFFLQVIEACKEKLFATKDANIVTEIFGRTRFAHFA